MGCRTTRGCYLVNTLLRIVVGSTSTSFTLEGDNDSENGRTVTIPITANGLATQELRRDPPSPTELSNAIALVQDHLDDVLREMPGVSRCDAVVGVGRPFAIVAAIELGATMELGAEFGLSRGAAEDVFRTMATEPLADRVHNPGLPRSEAETIVGGCCLVVAIMRRFDLTELTIRESEQDAAKGAPT
jgi:exopolyphosphatase / guanosine-5'-triphosphate,3'-diphosphate pyrophosphatase